MDIYNKPTDSKRYLPFTSNKLSNILASNNPQHCLTNISFSLASRICTIIENENVQEKRFKELKRTLLKQRYTKSLIEVSILKHKEIPFEILRQPKTPKNEEILRFTFTYNPSNPDVFSLIKQSFDNFQYSKTVSTISQRKKLAKSLSQAPNLVRLLYRSKFESQNKNNELKKCGKNFVISPYLLKASLYQFKRVKKFLLLKNSFNCESIILIYVDIFQGCKEEYIGRESGERANKCLQAKYKTGTISTVGS